MIPWASPLAQFQAHDTAIRAAVANVFESGVYVLGPQVEAFEDAFATYCGVTDAVGVGSGTEALVLALKALGIGPGDEVITVSHTALATAAAILAVGATPVLVDIDTATYLLDPAEVEAAVTAKSKAIVAVHLYGLANDMDAILAVARKSGLRVIEDCAQAAGGRFNGRRLGSLGDIGCFSFYPTKNLGAIGDGGMIVTSDRDLAIRIRRLRQYGWDQHRETREPGSNSRLDPIQAAILGVKLPFLDQDNERRRNIARFYGNRLSGLALTLPAVRNQADHVYHLYVVACDDRDALASHLSRAGVGTGIHYPVPVHLHGGYDKQVVTPKHGLSRTERVAKRILTLPLYPELTDAETETVVTSVRGYFGA